MERVPRYTSYPTAPHFHNEISKELYKEWLAKINDQHTLSLYFHIPYCKQLCWFCGCHTKIVNHYEPVKRYLDLLEHELTLLARLLPKAQVIHIHFGGGSPTMLNSQDFISLMNRIKKNFTLSSNSEIAIEIDPRTVDAAKIAAYAASGITRASLGVQDFAPQVQKAINRIQPYELVRDVITMLRQQNIQALNVDLIYGLPYQTVKMIQQTIDQTLSLEPDRISLFGYAHVPWKKKHQQLLPEEALPDPHLRTKLFNEASGMLKEAGYVAIGLDHFAKQTDSLTHAMQQGKLKRNFQGYTTDLADALLGIGISSISSLPQGYVQNTSSNIDYEKAIKNGNLPISKGIALSEDDIERRRIIMSLMCQLRAYIPKKRYVQELQRLEPYFKRGDINYDNEMLSIQHHAQNHLRLIASVFDSYLPKTTYKHSLAI